MYRHKFGQMHVYKEKPTSTTNNTGDNSDLRDKARHQIMTIQNTFSLHIRLFPPILAKETWENIRYLTLEYYTIGRSIMFYNSIKSVSDLAAKVVPKFAGPMLQSIVRDVAEYIKTEQDELILLLHDQLYPTDVNYDMGTEVVTNDDFSGYKRRGSLANVGAKMVTLAIKKFLGMDAFIDQIISGCTSMFVSEAPGERTTFNYIVGKKLAPENPQLRGVLALVETFVTYKYGPLQTGIRTTTPESKSTYVPESAF